MAAAAGDGAADPAAVAGAGVSTVEAAAAADAGGDEGDETVASWRTADKRTALLAACGEALHARLRDAETLSRFLVARKGVIADAAKMLLRHQQWREEECKCVGAGGAASPSPSPSLAIAGVLSASQVVAHQARAV